MKKSVRTEQSHNDTLRFYVMKSNSAVLATRALWIPMLYKFPPSEQEPWGRRGGRYVGEVEWGKQGKTRKIYPLFSQL